MALMDLAEVMQRFTGEIAGVVSCFDGVILQGRIPILSHADGITRFLTARDIKIFDFVEWATPATKAIKEHAEALAAQAGLQIDFVRKKNFRKEQRIEEVQKKRGRGPGLVWIFSALEQFTTNAPKYGQRKAFLVAKDRSACTITFTSSMRCLGCATCAGDPIDGGGIEHRMMDNAFVHMGDWEKAQKTADGFEVAGLHAKLEQWVKEFCPALPAGRTTR